MLPGRAVQQARPPGPAVPADPIGVPDAGPDRHRHAGPPAGADAGSSRRPRCWPVPRSNGAPTPASSATWPCCWPGWPAGSGSCSWTTTWRSPTRATCAERSACWTTTTAWAWRSAGTRTTRWCATRTGRPAAGRTPSSAAVRWRYRWTGSRLLPQGLQRGLAVPARRQPAAPGRPGRAAPCSGPTTRSPTRNGPAARSSATCWPRASSAARPGPAGTGRGRAVLAELPRSGGRGSSPTSSGRTGTRRAGRRPARTDRHRAQGRPGSPADHRARAVRPVPAGVAARQPAVAPGSGRLADRAGRRDGAGAPWGWTGAGARCGWTAAGRRRASRCRPSPRQSVR